VSAFATLGYPGPGTVDFYGNLRDSGGSGLVLTNVEGIGQAPIRAPIDDAPQADGGIVHAFHYGPRHLTLDGLVLPLGHDDAAKAALWSAMDGLVAALDAILRADGTFAWTPPGQTAHSLTVRCDVPVAFSGTFQKTFIFGLVAADPTIAVA
jgi:hypothetical protein